VFTHPLKCFIFYLWILVPFSSIGLSANEAQEGLPLFYWQEVWHGRKFINFGDYLSLKLVERIVGSPVRVYSKKMKVSEKKLLAIGSIMLFAADGDVIWGTGVSGKSLNPEKYKFTHLDIRSVRGPLTRKFLQDHFQIECPEIYGDPALLIPYFFPEFKRKKKPSYDYIIIPHFSEEHLFSKSDYDNVVYSTEPWDQIIEKMLDSKLVISTSLHGIIVAEAFGIPARLLKVTNNEPLFKYYDYYLGTNRPHFLYATSVEEALEMGGEPPFKCDLERLYRAFPFEFWPKAPLKKKLKL
jgi:pyruvyltransferase